MKINYLVRLDDACPEMDRNKWLRMFAILDRHDIKPLVGIIPNNHDPATKKDPSDLEFWYFMRTKQAEGWSFALHGYDHCCTTSDGGINPIHDRSEFAGLPLVEQKNKIKAGYEILIDHGIRPDFFFAPSHTFDYQTVQALRDETPIRFISDTIALNPYNSAGFTFIPQQMGQFRRILIPGYWTFCFHPNEMTDSDYERFEDFIIKYRRNFIPFDSLLKIDNKRVEVWGGENR